MRSLSLLLLLAALVAGASAIDLLDPTQLVDELSGHSAGTEKWKKPDFCGCARGWRHGPAPAHCALPVPAAAAAAAGLKGMLALTGPAALPCLQRERLPSLQGEAAHRQL